jgi:hypothetical protein
MRPLLVALVLVAGCNSSPESSPLENYAEYGLVLLAETPWSYEMMGMGDWADMLRESGLAACASVGSGATTAEAMRDSLLPTPLGGEIPSSDDVDAFDLVSVIFIAGVAAYCPDLATFSRGPALNDAWQRLTGGPAPFRPPRLETIEIPDGLIERLEAA